MDKLNQKYKQLSQALNSLEKAIAAFATSAKEQKAYNPHMTYEEEYQMHRDSVIQRFEYTVDLFWKYIKKYLESAQVITGINIPGEVIKTAYSLKIINAEEAEQILAMIKSRNLTSHIYVEEIAEHLGKEIPKYYKILNAIINRLKAN